MNRLKSLVLVALAGVLAVGCSEAQAQRTKTTAALSRQGRLVMPYYLGDITNGQAAANPTGQRGVVWQGSTAAGAGTHFAVTTSIAQPQVPMRLAVVVTDTTSTATALSCTTMTITGINGAGYNIVTETFAPVTETRTVTTRSYSKLTNITASGCLGTGAGSALNVTQTRFISLPMWPDVPGGTPSNGIRSWCRTNGNDEPRCATEATIDAIPYDSTSNSLDMEFGTGAALRDRIEINMWGY